MLLHKSQTVDFSLAADVDPKAGTPDADPNFKKTVFHLGTIDPLIAARIIDSNMEVRRVTDEDSRSVFHTDEQLYIFAQLGIKGWENFNAPFAVEEKTIYGFKVFAVKDELMSKFLLNDILEIGKAVKDLVTIGVKEIKN